MKMKALFACFFSLLVSAIIIMQTTKLLPTGRVSTGTIPGLARQQFVATYARLPLALEANQGQTDSSVKFLARGGGYTLFLTPQEAVLNLRKAGPVRLLQTAGPSRDRKGAVSDPALEYPPTTLRMKLIGVNPTPEITGLDELPGKVNYFIGNDATKWRTNVPTYAKVRYKDVYPGIDLVYYGNQRSPAADWRRLRDPGRAPGWF